MAPKVIHSKKSESPGYTRYYLDEPIGTGQNGVLATGSKMKLAEPYVKDIQGNDITEAEFTIVLHGQEQLELPNEVKELKFEGGSLSFGSSED